jgi:hypothetical protein
MQQSFPQAALFTTEQWSLVGGEQGRDHSSLAISRHSPPLASRLRA